MLDGALFLVANGLNVVTLRGLQPVAALGMRYLDLVGLRLVGLP